MKSLKVDVDIEHTYIGDRRVTLHAPPDMGVAPVMLHALQGEVTDNIKNTSDEVNALGLAALKDKSPQGTWTLEVVDKVQQDTGKIPSFTLAMEL